MGKFGYIAYLCREGKKKELMEEVGGIAKMTGKTCEEVADGFIEAHDNAEKQKNDPAFTEIAKSQAKSAQFYVNEYLLDQESKAEEK